MSFVSGQGHAPSPAALQQQTRQNCPVSAKSAALPAVLQMSGCWIGRQDDVLQESLWNELPAGIASRSNLHYY